MSAHQQGTVVNDTMRQAAAILRFLRPDPHAADHREDLDFHLDSRRDTCIVAGCKDPVARLGYCTRHHAAFARWSP